MGLQGSLTPGQIVEQAVAARRLLYEEDVAAGVALHATPITNLVYMGMGGWRWGPGGGLVGVVGASGAGGWEQRAQGTGGRDRGMCGGGGRGVGVSGGFVVVVVVVAVGWLGACVATVRRGLLSVCRLQHSRPPAPCPPPPLPPGEPLHNLPAVLASIDTLCRPLGMHFSHNKARHCCGVLCCAVLCCAVLWRAGLPGPAAAGMWPCAHRRRLPACLTPATHTHTHTCARRSQSPLWA